MPLIRANNTDLIKDQARTWLTASIAAGVTPTLTVKDSAGFDTSIANPKVLIGELGSETAEIVALTSATPPHAMVVGTTTYAHSIDEPVTQILYNQVEFYYSTTSSTSGIVGAATTTKSIDVSSKYTLYNDVTYTTGYAFIRFKNASAYSSYSSAIPYTGLVSGSVGKIIEQGLNLTNETISDLITHDFLVNEVNNWQNEVVRQKDWDWEFDTITSLTMLTNTQAYNIPSTLKYGYTDRSILQIRVDDGDNYIPLKYVDRITFNELDIDSPTGLPAFYTIWDSQLLLSPTPTSTYNANTISMDVWKAITEVNDDGDTVTVPFFTIAPYYLAWKIEARKGNDVASEKWRQLYESRLAGEMRREHGQKQFPGFKIWGGFQ